MKLAITFPFPPVPAIRMTRAQVNLLRIPPNKVKPENRALRDRLERCIANKENLCLFAKVKKFKLPEAGFEIIFWIETKEPSRWGHGHKAVPDVDNLCKQLLDALCSSDSHIYSMKISKFWCKPGEGRTEVWV